MLKKLAILGVFVALLLGWPSMAEDNQGRAHTGHNAAKTIAAVVPPTHVAIDTPILSPCTQEKPCWQKDAAAEKLLPKWRRPEWVIVYVTIVYAFLAWLQWRTIKRQAEEMKLQRQQTAEFFRTEKRPWVGMLGSLSLQNKKSTKPGYFGFTVEYTVKNFGVSPAFNTVVPFGATLEGADMNNYPLVKSKVDDARRNGENIVNMTGDLLLPGAEKTETCEFPETQREQKFIVTGCIVYRFADGTIHHTELSYWIDLNEGEKARFRTLWFQAAD